MVKALLLDADGVVIKNHDYFSSRYKKDFGGSLNDNVISDFFRNDYKKAAVGQADLKAILNERLRQWGWNGTVEELLKYWFEGERELDNEILDTVKKLREKGIKCYLASDNEKYRAEFLLNEVGIKQLFDDTFFSCFLEHTKSDPEFFRKVIEKLNIKPEEIEYWDDDPKNVEIAKSVGVDAKLYTNTKELIESSKKL